VESNSARRIATIRPVPGRVRSRCAAFAVVLVACVGIAGCAALPSAHTAGRLARAELMVLLQTFNADLLSHDSATLTLERWCADHHLADPARVVARRVPAASKPLPDDLRAKLAIGATEPVGYRRVQLVCGAHVLSEADNWYVPGRLTADMNRQLDTTDQPFGRIAAPLGFQRRTLAARLLWSPLPAGWEMARNSDPALYASGPSAIPHDVLRHEAILYSSTQTPISAVVETYTNEIFDFGDWRGLVRR